jgi:hypothetical protein
MKTRRRVVFGNPARCYLCGFPIPGEVVSPLHPLFGTVDHVIATSRNGRDNLRNRAPAHRVCNMIKGDRLVNPATFAAQCHEHVIPMLIRLGRAVSSRARKRALAIAAEAWPAWAPTLREEPQWMALQRWDDDGGRPVAQREFATAVRATLDSSVQSD